METKAGDYTADIRHAVKEIPKEVCPTIAKLDGIHKTLNERGKRYGAFTGQAEITQTLSKKFYEFFLTENPTAVLTSVEKEAIHMIFHKLGRIANGDPHYKDSWVDIAGYATLVADTLKD